MPYTKTLAGLITTGRARCFLVGNNGAFDRMAPGGLRCVSREYSGVSCSVVICGLPRTRQEGDPLPEETLFPEGLETVPPRWAIVRRNRWMVSQADVVAVHARRPGGADRARAYALLHNRRIIEIELPAKEKGCSG